LRIVVDANVAIKWTVAEDHRESARLLIPLADRLIAPDLIRAELASICWKKIGQGEMTVAQAGLTLEGLARLLPDIVSSEPYLSRALSIALTLQHSPYDCLYLALAEAAAGILVTADRRFLARCRGTPLDGRAMALDDPDLARRLDAST